MSDRDDWPQFARDSNAYMAGEMTSEEYAAKHMPELGPYMGPPGQDVYRRDETPLAYADPRVDALIAAGRLSLQAMPGYNRNARRTMIAALRALGVAISTDD